MQLFFFVNYFKEKLVLFVEKISRKGNVRKRTMREDEVKVFVFGLLEFGAKNTKRDSREVKEQKTIEVEIRTKPCGCTRRCGVFFLVLKLFHEL
jgi:hypothetical protein